MKKAIHIFLIISLSLSIVMIGKGVNLVICEHSHTVQFFPSKTKKKQNISHCSSCHCPEQEQDCSDQDKDCMNKIYYSLSQSEITQKYNIDFSPIVSFMICPFAFITDKENYKKEEGYFKPYPKPPRDYLSRITILLI